jgi:ketosteroid isomerase-like protein
MPISLPPAIELFVRIENSNDIEALAECFTPDATVRDEGHSYDGLDAIREWKAATKKKYQHTVAPLDIVQRDGKTVLRATLTGDFPGSPVTLDFSFVLKDGKILSLTIH